MNSHEEQGMSPVVNSELTHQLQNSSLDASSSTKQPVEKMELLNLLVDMVVRYKFLGRESHICFTYIKQAVEDRLFHLEYTERKNIFTGSRYEGMPLEVCGDWDMMVMKRNHPKVLHENSVGSASTPKNGFIYAKTNTGKPAFLSLRIPNGFSIDESCMVAVDGEGYFNTRKFVFSFRNDSSANIHGPALTGYASQYTPSYGEQDTVPCLFSPTWPRCTDLFFQWQRPHGWPSKETLNNLWSEGCHVVGVGHPSSKAEGCETEWRWSFSQAERKLINQMKTVFVGCMFVLKALKRCIWEPKTTKVEKCAPKAFCSYFIKTACLWVFESNPTGRILFLIPACEIVIDWLEMCYRQRRMPHYFIPSYNLIGHLTKDYCETVSGNLLKMKENLWYHAISNISFEGLLADPFKFVFRENCISPESNFKELMINLQAHPKAKQIVSSVIRLMKPGSKFHLTYKRNVMWLPISIQTLWSNLSKLIKRSITEKEFYTVRILKFPESVLLPIIEQMPTLIQSSHVIIYRKLLYLQMGDLYSSLMIHCQNVKISLDLCSPFADHPLKYYNLSRNITYADGWNDNGILANLYLAKFYYFANKEEQLNVHFNLLVPQLQQVRISMEYFRSLPNLYFYPQNLLFKAPLRRDEKLFHNLIKPCKDEFIFVNPIAFAYYMMARTFIVWRKHVDLENAKDGLKWCAKNVWTVELTQSTEHLLKIVDEVENLA